MTELAEDTRVVAADHERYNASLVRREDLTESLAYFWVRFDGEPTPFEPGQYMTIGVMADGRLVQRPYSVASSPTLAGTDGYEMYVRLVNEGQFTPLLFRSPLGQRMRMIGPKGKFTLEPDDDRVHLFISSGTGNAPFVSMMRRLIEAGRPRRTVFINGVSYVHELGYRDLIEGWAKSGAYPVTYVPTVSRPRDPMNAGWDGRIGRAEVALPEILDEFDLQPGNAIAYICGNPDMIAAADALLVERGFPEEQIRKELYWPKGKEPRGVPPEHGAPPVE
ncbi:MAG: FAD-binding oxidoreductase [Chloroflexota bacterium]